MFASGSLFQTDASDEADDDIAAQLDQMKKEDLRAPARMHLPPCPFSPPDFFCSPTDRQHSFPPLNSNSLAQVKKNASDQEKKALRVRDQKARSHQAPH